MHDLLPRTCGPRRFEWWRRSVIRSDGQTWTVPFVTIMISATGALVSIAFTLRVADSDRREAAALLAPEPLLQAISTSRRGYTTSSSWVSSTASTRPTARMIIEAVAGAVSRALHVSAHACITGVCAPS